MEELKLGDIIFLTESKSVGAKITKIWQDIRYKNKDSFNPTHVAIAMGDQSVIIHSLIKGGVQLGTTTFYAKKREYLDSGIMVFRCKEIAGTRNISKLMELEKFLLFCLGFKYNLKVPFERKSKKKLYCSELAATMISRFTQLPISAPEQYLPKALLLFCKNNNFELIDVNLGYFNKPKVITEKYNELFKVTEDKNLLAVYKQAYENELKLSEVLENYEKTIINYYKFKKETAEVRQLTLDTMDILQSQLKKGK